MIDAPLPRRPDRRHLPIARAAAEFLPRGVTGPEAFPRPIYCVWEITLRCDLACHHCGSRAGRARADELTTAEALDAVRQLAELGVRDVTLIGGEAYLREDWLQIVAAIRDHGMTPSMTTGGRGLTPERARGAFDAGMRLVSVSLDGDEPAHDRQRGLTGSWRAAVAAIDAVRAAGMTAAVNTQVNRASAAHLEDVLDAMIAHGARLWQVQLTVPMGRAADHPELLLQPHDLLEVFPALAAARRRAAAAGIGMWPGNNVGYYGPLEELLWGDRRAGHSSACGAGQSTLGLESDGVVKGCPSLATDPFGGGSLRTRSLVDIWKNAPQLRHTRERTVAELWGYCAECYYGDTCRAGCTWTAHSVFGRPGNNPYCHHRALEMDKRGLREVLVPVARAPGTPFDHGLFELRQEAVARPPPAQVRREEEVVR